MMILGFLALLFVSIAPGTADRCFPPLPPLSSFTACTGAFETSGTLTAAVLMLRSDVRGTIRGRLLRGDAVTILGRRDGWENVRLPDGRTGWVAGGYLKTRSGPLASFRAWVTTSLLDFAPAGKRRSPRSGRRMSVRLTGYYPPPPGGYRTKREARMEGGPNSLIGKLRPLEQYNAKDPADYVSCATDPRRIRTGTFFTIDRHPGVRFLACDIGGRIRGARVDVCVKDEAASYAVTGGANVHLQIGGSR